MTTLRINLHIRDDVSPLLYQVLAALPPKPRAEFLRKIADIGLRHMQSPLPSTSASAILPSTASADTADCFGDDLAQLLAGDL